MTIYTQQKAENQNTLMTYYQGIVAVAAVLVFFTKLDNYLEGIGIGLPLFWMIGFIFISLPLLPYIIKRSDRIPITIIIWCVGSLMIPLISILILPEAPDMQLFEDQIRIVIFLVLMLLIFSGDSLVMKWVRLAILLVTLFNVVGFVYEFFNPAIFYLEQHAPGRSSGFYRDANSAGYAVIVGMILTIDLIKSKYRLFYSLFVLLGVLSTFSRGAMLCWLMVMLIFIAAKAIPSSQIPLLFLTIFVSMTILSTQVNNLAHMKTADGDPMFTDGTLARVDFLFNPTGQEDDSSAGRLSHVDEAWRKFANRPFIGNGLGSGGSSTHIASNGSAQRSHNMYLDRMVEYGFLGALVYPWLLVATVWEAQGETRKYTFAFLIIGLMWGFFSHTLMSTFINLIIYAIVANFAKQSSLESLQR